jgi:nitroreductase
MDSFETLIINRRSTRQYKEESLTQDEVHLLLQAALLAPTSKNSKSWEFVATENRTLIKSMSECKDSGAAFLGGSALAIAVLGDRTKSDIWVEDASIAAAYMQLQAEALNIGSCWCHIRDRYLGTRPSEDIIRELLAIPPHFGVLCIIGFGRKGQVRKPNDLSKLTWEQVHIDAFPTQNRLHIC